MRSIGIIGAGGMARDALSVLDAMGIGGRVAAFFESSAYWTSRTLVGIDVLPIERFDPIKYDALVALGNGTARERLVDELPPQTRYPTYVHPSVVPGRNVELGSGTLVCAGCILTCDILVGQHVQLNIGTTITHDCTIHDFATAAPGVRLSGGCTIGRAVFLGANSVLRERTAIAAGVVVGMGSVVVASIDEPGTYVGVPARRRT